jgi:Xaa-Pro aminopeptidase
MIHAFLPSQVPLQTKLVDTSLLSHEELAWVDAYHATCREKLAPLLEGSTREWLMKATEPLSIKT